MIKSVYTYFRLVLLMMPFIFLFYDKAECAYTFFAVCLLFSISIPAKRLIKKGTLAEFEMRLNYFMDEFFVYGAVIFLSKHHYAPLWVVIVYFFKDATIGAIRNFAIKSGEELKEKYGYKIDKIVQYTLIICASFNLLRVVCFDCFGSIRFGSIPYVKYFAYAYPAFYLSAAISALTLVIFFIANKDFMRKMHHS